MKVNKISSCFIVTFIQLCKYLSNATIDINIPELHYLADHLTSEECRKLVAAAHFKNYELPNALSEAELKVTKDLSCFQLLLHWNSSPGEGKGQTHEILEHRLRQLGKYQLADTLGKTVFDEIGKDLEMALESGLKNSDNESTSEDSFEDATVKYEDPTEWTPIDSILFSLLSVLLIACAFVCGIVLFRYVRRKVRQCRNKPPRTYRKIELSETSDSESEEKFDIRNTNVYMFTD
ncbi:uncharacterized protein LOC123322805 [Coccinella septempunctata]|uniref:uncharacterized protein LOC123322805 n=1 Tax=Coccinella septempunctata TaxID=41139 RepID=UPI001D05DA6D|nr:uncharacterized protein LOC123322805 [Coccinella septempunctata]